MRAHRLNFVPVVIGLAVVLAGCTTTAKKNSPAGTDAAVEQATTLADNGQTAKAIDTLDTAAKADPVSPKPWLKKAQIQFQAADYPSAIQSAEEAAKRDPADKEARSISIVAALRIAIRGLVELRGQEDLGENAYAEAQRLASVLKASLGTEVLVPAEDAAAAGLTSAPAAPSTSTQPQSRRPAPAPVRTVPAKPVPKKAPAAAPPATDPPKDSSADPFKDLH